MFLDPKITLALVKLRGELLLVISMLENGHPRAAVAEAIEEALAAFEADLKDACGAPAKAGDAA